MTVTLVILCQNSTSVHSLLSLTSPIPVVVIVPSDLKIIISSHQIYALKYVLRVPYVVPLDNFHAVTGFTFPDYLNELHQMHPIFTLWSASEPELSPVLLAMAAAIEHNAQAQQNVLVTYTPDIAQVNAPFCFRLRTSTDNGLIYV